MKTSPLPFSPTMARAWYADIKTQTRRVIVPQPEPGIVYVNAAPGWIQPYVEDASAYGPPIACPYGGPGDRTWIRETLVPNPAGWISYECDGALADDGRPVVWPWKVRKIVPRYMPRWACRSYGEILAVRVEQVQDISEADARAEGVIPLQVHSPQERRGADDYRGGFAVLWNEINAERGYGWDANPWVWALTLRRLP